MPDQQEPNADDAGRARLREQYLKAWRKARNGERLEALELLIAEVVELHPEYHALLEDRDVTQREFPPEAGQSNPFLHMGLHVAIHEQLGADRPPGIREVYTRLAGRFGDTHELEHRMMECLARIIWEAQRSGMLPDEAAYLACVRKLR